MSHRSTVAAIAAAATMALCGPSQAADVALDASESWHAFSVDSLLAPTATPLAWIDDSGSPLGRATFTLGPGSYRTSGLPTQSVTLAGDPLDATVGGIRLTTVSAIPEPSSIVLLLAGLGASGAYIRRRRDVRA